MHLISGKSAALDEVSRNGLHLRFVCDDLKSDTDIVLAAVRQDGLALEHAPDEHKSNIAIVLAAVRQNSAALYFAANTAQQDKRVVLTAVRKQGGTLRNASATLKADRDVVLAAVRDDGWALEHASPELQDDNEISLCAVQQSGWALKYASERLRNDSDFVLAAISRNGSALCHASHALKTNAHFIARAVRTNQDALLHVPEALRADDQIIQAAKTGRAMVAVERAANAAHTPHPKRSLSPTSGLEPELPASATSPPSRCQTFKQRGARRTTSQPSASPLSVQCHETGVATHPPATRDNFAGNQEIRRLCKIIVDLQSHLNEAKLQNQQLREEISRNCAALTAHASFEHEAHIKIRELYAQNSLLHAENTRLLHARVVDSGHFSAYSDSSRVYQRTLYEPSRRLDANLVTSTQETYLVKHTAVAPAPSSVHAEAAAASTSTNDPCAPVVV